LLRAGYEGGKSSGKFYSVCWKSRSDGSYKKTTETPLLAISLTTTLASHSLPYRFKNLHLRVGLSYRLWNLPLYMTSMLVPCSASNPRTLKSATRWEFTVLRTKKNCGNRAFPVSWPREWNSLRVTICQSSCATQVQSKWNSHLCLRTQRNALSCMTCLSNAHHKFLNVLYRCFFCIRKIHVLLPVYFFRRKRYNQSNQSKLFIKEQQQMIIQSCETSHCSNN